MRVLLADQARLDLGLHAQVLARVHRGRAGRASRRAPRRGGRGAGARAVSPSRWALGAARRGDRGAGAPGRAARSGSRPPRAAPGPGPSPRSTTRSGSRSPSTPARFSAPRTAESRRDASSSRSVSPTVSASASAASVASVVPGRRRPGKRFSYRRSAARSRESRPSRVIRSTALSTRSRRSSAASREDTTGVTARRASGSSLMKATRRLTRCSASGVSVPAAGGKGMGSTSSRSMREPASSRTRPIQENGSVTALTVTVRTARQMVSRTFEARVADPAAHGNRELDVAAAVLHQRHQHAQRHPDAVLRLVARRRAEELELADAEIGLRGQRVAVHLAMEGGVERARARLPADLLQHVRVGARDREVADLAGHVHEQRPIPERAHGAPERHLAEGPARPAITIRAGRSASVEKPLTWTASDARSSAKGGATR